MHWNFTDILTPPEKPYGPSDGPIIAEIGFGNGEYLEHLAKTRPDCTIIGIEISQWCVTKAARRALSAGSGNIRLILGDARNFFRYAFEPNSVSEVYMNFPCPWPKRRHAERRVASPRFAALIGGRLALGGTFTLATDVEWYAEQTREAFLSNGSFSADPVERNPARDYVTKYERKWREMGRETFVTKAIKTAEIPGEETGREGDGTPETAADQVNPNIDGLDLRRELSRITGTIIRKDEYVVIFKEIFTSGSDAALISVISADEGFEQHYYIKVVHSGSQWIGKLDSIGCPYRTPGVRASLRYLSKAAGIKF
ncbi:MAG: tRNA (guanosine(46)-N7)-methyltransferase TrmB [Synergistaceae bacterium]|jgi:tRNA (guanine-N7-)-methyltransferase|nr:tRNA (guanosine(46)-N7)-methyltransferase TrmB [Synergistaceae bacterium]